MSAFSPLTMKLCGDSDVFDLTSPCIRGSWAALAPSALVLTICLSLVPLPKAVQKVVDVLKSPFVEFMSLHEVEGLALADERNLPETQLEVDVNNIIPLWRTVLFVFIGLLECLAWVASGTFLLMTGHPRWAAIQQFLVASTWLYTVERPILRPTATPPYDMLTLYMLHIAGGTFQLGGYLFQHTASGAPLPETFVLAGLAVNLAALVGLVTVIMGMPMGLPLHLVKKADIGSSVSPKDYTILWGWVTTEKSARKDMGCKLIGYHVTPFVSMTWLVSYLVGASSMDFILTLFSIVFTYAEPFFLKRILDALDTSNDPLGRGQCDVQHLWFARRACTRMCSELDEVSDQVSTLKKDCSGPASPESEDDDRLGFENVSFKWNKVENAKEDSGDKNADTGIAESETSSILTAEHQAGAVVDHKFELKDLLIIFPQGELTVVTGLTASGKTALLMAVLGEMTSLPGGWLIMAKNTSKIDAHGNMHAISYAAQSPWLRHQSIKDNILFGYPFDEARYNEVIECCALRTDFGILEDSDATEIRDKGVSLSGSQKAWVTLARAVYAKTKYVLLDDPLSAVDSHTSQILYEKCLRGPLLANWTVVLVTHHVQLVLPGAHYLVRMLDGCIDTQGTVKQLRAQGVLDDIAHDAAVEVKKEELAIAKEPDVNPEDPEQIKKPCKLVEDEHREVGALIVVLLQLLGVGKKASIFFAIPIGHLTIPLRMQIWIKTWGEAYNQKPNSSVIYRAYRSLTLDHHILMDGQISRFSTFEPHLSTTGFLNIKWPSAVEHPLFYIGIYTVIGLTTAFISIMSSVLQFTGALRASRKLFKALLVTVVQATFRFHDTTPQGRMLNQFGQDIETIDQSLANSLQQVNSSLAGFFAALLTVIVVFPVFLIPASLIGWFYYTFAVGYLNTGRDLRQMESNSRSPIFSDFGELLNGIVTVRAFAAEKRFLDHP
ncbi:hypothetical protein K438DRAFT_1953861 [Mycena galopus ATCC 62051]|nr:hypothetical protein K438DRAFT_1953861 [Mycena galopus ATCC 62051]